MRAVRKELLLITCQVERSGGSVTRLVQTGALFIFCVLAK